MKFSCILLCLIAISALSPLYAQGRIDAGVIGGLNISKAIIEADEGDDPATATQNEFVAGILGDFRITPTISFGANILFLRRGVEVTTEDDLVFDVWANYIEIPVYFKFSYGTKYRPYVLLGPSLGFLLDSEVDLELGGLGFTGDFTSVLKNSDMSLIIGAGVEAPLWTGRAFVQARYIYGIQDILKGGTIELRAGQTLRQYATINAGDNLYTRDFHIMTGFSLPILD